MRALAWWLAFAPVAAPLAAQRAWNDSASLALVARAIARRQQTIVDSGLVDYRARAHGFVFFLGQLGEGFADPPQLIKSDQLVLEVYWKAPSLSKQRILGWRDRRDLPTDIIYHRDHLGIVQNNFANLIRLGDGDEVRDVPHPLSLTATEVYDYALHDSLLIAIPQRTVRVLEVRVRPKNLQAPRLVGSLFIDAEQHDLVRMAFSFTAAAYLDRQLEDISIVLDHALWDGRHWLPYRQEIEIRRRATWLELPARGIIRGRWEIGDYELNLGLPDEFFRGPEIVAVPRAVRDTFPWQTSLDEAVVAAVAPIERRDLAELRALTADLAERYALSGLAPVRLGATRVSDVVRANRVEGLALGGGLVLRALDARLEVRPRLSYGLADSRLKGALAARFRAGGLEWEAEAHRVVRDVADEPPVSPLVNSISAQEFGRDAGDYYLATGGSVSAGLAIGARRQLVLEAGADRVRSVAIAARPATGEFRDNPPLGLRTTWRWAAVRLRHLSGTMQTADVATALAVEVGDGERAYWRLAAAGQSRAPLGSGVLELSARLGVAGAGLPAHRTFLLGGRGTLLGEPYRAYGGRQMALARAEWRHPVSWLDFELGRYGRMRRSLVVAPYVGAGWVGGAVPGAPGDASPGVRPVAGIGFEWLRVLRVDLGIGLRTGRFGAAVDLTRGLWGVL